MRSTNPVHSLAKQRQFVNMVVSLPFDDQAAMEYGRIRADLAAYGTPIGSNDLLIAAIALVHQLILVTHTTHEFQRIHGLLIEDWEV